MSTKPPVDPRDSGVMSGDAWDELCDTLRQFGQIAVGEGVPDSPRSRAEGLRYLTRFLDAGITSCVSHDDPDFPVFGRMIDYTMPWGLDNPDCLYLYAAIRGGAVYRISGSRGSANHIDIQVNYGHYANGDISSWGTISSLDGDDLELGPDGQFEALIAEQSTEGTWLKSAPNAEFVLVRQYFDDWENERPADLLIERVGAEASIPPLRTDQIAARISKLRRWLDRGANLWENMSKGLLGMEPNSLVVHMPESAGERSGMRGQAYGMGNFQCASDEVVILEFTPPLCRHWGVSLANWYWEAVEYASRQTSINGHQARLDSDGVFRGVIAHRDPGVPNWLDTSGYDHGSLAARFLLADTAPRPVLRRLPWSDLRNALPDETPRVAPELRAEQLARRRRAVHRRFRS